MFIFRCSRFEFSLTLMLTVVTALSLTTEAARSGDIPTELKCEDEDLRGFQDELLSVACETASCIPKVPHVKDRSKSQEQVVRACLELGLPNRAKRYAEGIVGWRKGVCFTEIAVHLIHKGCLESAHECLSLAERLSEDEEEWRKERVETAAARTRRELQKALEESHSEGPADRDSLHSGLSILKDLVDTGDFESMKFAVSGYLDLWDEHYPQLEDRMAVEEGIRKVLEVMPVIQQIEALCNLAEISIEYSDAETSLKLLREAQSLVDSHGWPLENRIPMASRIISLRCKAGESTGAREDADHLYEAFNNEGNRIVDIYRAETLVPLASAYAAMGESALAKEVFSRAIEEGVKNPNSRPRAEDLSLACSQMAVSGTEPDGALWDRIRAIQKGLDSPW